MSKDYTRKNKIAGQFSWRTIEMMESPAFRILSHSGRRILDRLEIELAHHGGVDNGRLPCTFDHFTEYGIDRHSIAPALREAEALKFIEITERGRAGNAEYRRPNLFRLTYKPVGRAMATDEWRMIETEAEARMLAKTARKARKEKHSPVGGITKSQEGIPHRKPEIHSGNAPTKPIVEKPTLPLYLDSQRGEWSILACPSAFSSFGTRTYAGRAFLFPSDRLPKSVRAVTSNRPRRNVQVRAQELSEQATPRRQE